VADSRVSSYAALLVERCVDVQPGWQVLVVGEPRGRPLCEEVVRHIAGRGAYALTRISFRRPDPAWLNDAPVDLIERAPEIEAHEIDNADAFISVEAPENTRAGSDVPADRLALRRQALRPHYEPYFGGERPWVGCQYPTPALAQDAGMSVHQFEDFLFGAVLVDWEALRARMERIAERFDAGSEVRVVGAGTDLRFSLAGRHGCVDALGANMPGGEIFYSPLEDSATGEVEFSEFPACYFGRAVDGVRLRFEGGRVVDASASSDEDFLVSTLDTDEGARVLGEFGIGCNPGITRHLKNTLFDEKMEGTVHFALGSGFAFLGGTNLSAVHWDMVKDLRGGGRIEIDGEVVQEGGAWLV
jgi:aminopeptidase